MVDTYNSLYSEGRSASMSGDKPPIPTRPVRPTPPAPPRGSSSPSIARSPPPLPPRDTSALGETVSLPDQRETLLAEMIDEKSQPPTYSGRRPSEAVAIQDAPRRGSRPVQPTLASNKRPFFNRLLLAGEVVLTSLEATTHVIINSSTAAASSAAG